MTKETSSSVNNKKNVFKILLFEELIRMHSPNQLSFLPFLTYKNENKCNKSIQF